MLVIRMQRTGRKGHAQFRVVVQDSRRTPTSGKIVAALGHFDPHTKQTSLDKEKASFYLEHGAQPSERVIRLLTQEGVKLPGWVNVSDAKSRSIRHSDKLRKNRPAEEKPEPKATATEPVESDETEQPAVEASAEIAEDVKEPTEAVEEPKPSEESAEKPSE